MNLTTDSLNNEKNLSELGKAIISHRDEILKRWEESVRAKMPEAKNLSLPILINTIPAFIDNMAEAVSVNHPRPSTGFYNNLANEHGGERARQTPYTHEHLIREYQILRWVIMEVLIEKNIHPKPEELMMIHASIDEAIQESANAFALVHMEIRDQYIATLSHDMKNPLAAISMAADLIIRKASDPQALLKQAGKIKKSTIRINKMIDDLLDETIIKSSDRIALKLELVEANVVIEDVLDELEGNLANRIRVEGIPHIKGYWDRSYLRRAIENLISNAIKYSDPDTEIIITLEEKFERFIFRIHNSGNPIPIEERELIFQVYRRAKAAKEGHKIGWGLGLPLVRAVAEAHGGSSVVDSGPELGTTFIIDIPVDARPFQNGPQTERLS